MIHLSHLGVTLDWVRIGSRFGSNKGWKPRVRSKRFRSSYRAKVEARKKNGKGKGRRKEKTPTTLFQKRPFIHFTFRLRIDNLSA